MKTVAFLGLGAMGSRMARHILDAGHPLRVYNRTPERAQELAAGGATVCATAREAVEGSHFVVACVTDDSASRELWEHGSSPALEGLSEGVLAIEASTLTPQRIHELAPRVQARGARFLDAPVLGSRPQADARQLISVVGGDDNDLAEALAVIEAYSGAVHAMGGIGAGAIAKLAVNALMGIQTVAGAEVTSMAIRAGLDRERVYALFQSIPTTSPLLQAFLQLMRAEDHAPRFPVDLIAKDLRYFAQTARDCDADATLTSATRAVFERAREEGQAELNLTSIDLLYPK